jgi:hypothetical protein
VPTRLSADIAQYFLLEDTPFERAARQEEQRRGVLLSSQSAQKVYQPAILAWGQVHFQDSRRSIDHTEEHSYLLPVPEDLAWVDWQQNRVTLERDDLQTTPPAGAQFVDIPPSVGGAKKWKALQKDLNNFLYREVRLTIYRNKSLKLYSEVGESQGRFVQRCQEVAAELQKAKEEKVNAKFESRMARLEDRLQREERELHADRVEYEGRKREETLSLGESVLGLFTGRRRSRTFSEVSRRRRLTSQAQADVQESEEVITDLEKQIAELRREWDQALQELTEEAAEVSRQVEEVQIKPRKTDIDLTVFGLAWVPYWHVAFEDASGASRTLMLAAYQGRST